MAQPSWNPPPDGFGRPAGPGYGAPGGWPSGPWGQQPPAWGRQAVWHPPAGYPPPRPFAPVGPGWGPQPPPPPTSSPLKYLLFALIGVTAVAFAALIVISLTNSGGGGTEDGGYVDPGYTPPPPARNPPDLPEPQTYAQAKDWTTKNKLYQQTVPQPIKCADLTRIPDWGSATPDQLEQHLDALTGCLVTVWHTPLEKAGYTIVRPTVTVYHGEADSPCGDLPRENAVYCAADQQVYVADDVGQIFPDLADDDSTVLDFVIGHEFGHAVQARSGILVSAKALQQQAGKTPAGLEESRRIEQQADCLSGLYNRAVSKWMQLSQSDIQAILQAANDVGDPPGKEGDHGQSANRVAWATRGLNGTTVGVCNTFTAPASQVR